MKQLEYVTLEDVRQAIADSPISMVIVMGRLARDVKNILLKEGKQVIEVNDGGVYTTTIEWN